MVRLRSAEFETQSDLDTYIPKHHTTHSQKQENKPGDSIVQCSLSYANTLSNAIVEWSSKDRISGAGIGTDTILVATYWSLNVANKRYQVLNWVLIFDPCGRSFAGFLLEVT